MSNHPYTPAPDSPEPPRAACVGRWTAYESSTIEGRAAAVAICNTCPLTCDERRTADTPGNVPSVFHNCGTAAGYEKHRRRDEPVCEPCMDARSEQGQRYRAAAKARRADAA